MPTDFWEEDGSNAPQTNPMGTAGFIVSLIGVLTCGSIAPIGLILSLLALKNEPKATAKAGVITGIVGTLVGIVAVFVFLQMQEDSRLEDEALGSATQIAEELQEKSGDALKVQIDQRTIVLQNSPDPWHKPMMFAPLEGEFELRSAGPDGKYNTDDDLAWVFPSTPGDNESKVRKVE